jgi:predicted exporter
MIVLAVTFATWALPRFKTETDLLQLLPQARGDAAADAAVSHFSDALARELLFLVGASNPEEAKAAGARFARALEQSHAFSRVSYEIGVHAKDQLELTEAHRFYLLSDRQRDWLVTGKTDRLNREALRAAFTPAGLVRALPFREDPLGLVADFMKQQQRTLGAARLDGDVLGVATADRYYVLIAAECAGSAFATDVQDRVMAAVQNAKREARGATITTDAEVTIVTSGVLPHANQARRRAQTELSVFGTVDTLSVVVLILAVLGTWRPLLLAILVLGLSTIAGITACLLVFGRIHLLALVFGSSLIGVVIDYSLHFLADRFRAPDSWTPLDALRHVGPAILLGLATTLIGYCGLMLMPFPGLRQIAVFCGVGLVTGAGSVLCLYPVLARRSGRTPKLGPRIGRAIDGFMSRWRWTASRIAIGVLAGLALAGGVLRLEIHDDIRALQNTDPALAAEERDARDLLGTTAETRFFLVQGATEQAVLEREEQLTQLLNQLIVRHALDTYVAVSRALPSFARQDENHRLLAKHVYSRTGVLPSVLTQLGFPAATIERQLSSFSGAASKLTPQTWLGTSTATPYRDLWLGRVGMAYTTVVTLGGIHDIPSLAEVAGAVPGVRFIDRVNEISTILSRYREATTALLALAYLIAGAVLTLRFGWRRALKIAVPSLAASVLTLGALGWAEVPINLFNMLALLMVLALGIDYGIFLQHGGAARSTAILSVTLSALTTLLAFGPLGFSATPFIRSIGLTLLMGISASWLLVLFSCLTVACTSTARPAE